MNQPGTMGNCPACRRFVSREAVSCPSCGQPLRQTEGQQMVGCLYISIAIIVGFVSWNMVMSKQPLWVMAGIALFFGVLIPMAKTLKKE
jgi:uncharacterized protein (DUF983 family)